MHWRGKQCKAIFKPTLFQPLKLKTGWDLDALFQVLQCFLHLDKLLLQQQRNYMGLKITVCLNSWGKFCTKEKTNKQKTWCHF